ncbi:MAG: hypothetical protein R3E62_03660 [Pseudomonadales bacterium]
MTTIASKIEGLVNELKIQRDTLHSRLGQGDGRVEDQWSEAEEKWQEVEAKYERLDYAVGKTTLNLGRDLEQLGCELKQRYQQIQAQLS